MKNSELNKFSSRRPLIRVLPTRRRAKAGPERSPLRRPRLRVFGMDWITKYRLVVAMRQRPAPSSSWCRLVELRIHAMTRGFGVIAAPMALFRSEPTRYPRCFKIDSHRGHRSRAPNPNSGRIAFADGKVRSRHTDGRIAVNCLRNYTVG